MISLKSLSKSFGSNKVLNNVSLDISPGKMTFIIGKSGTGKSVLMKIIAGLLPVDSGQVFVGQKDVGKLTHFQLINMRKQMGFLFQHSALLDSISVIENVVFPLKEHEKLPNDQIYQRGEELLKMVGMDKHRDSFSAELSVGERKRVGLARALILKPKILLYDEPTTGLDPIISSTIEELMSTTQKLYPYLTSVIITHDIHNALSYADQIVLLSKGRIRFNGTTDEFVASNDKLVTEFIAGRPKIDQLDQII